MSLSFSDIFILVDGGEVDQLVTSADPTVAELFFLPTSVAEFPVNWCISIDAFEVRPVFNIAHTPDGFLFIELSSSCY